MGGGHTERNRCLFQTRSDNNHSPHYGPASRCSARSTACLCPAALLTIGRSVPEGASWQQIEMQSDGASSPQVGGLWPAAAAAAHSRTTEPASQRSSAEASVVSRRTSSAVSKPRSMSPSRLAPPHGARCLPRCGSTCCSPSWQRR
eukprot:scaffold99419_cov39-Phaeocystis_antarctica.AAC.2